ncbi:MAG: ligand-binding sensor domain-containing protein [Patiriisocius sp.]
MKKILFLIFLLCLTPMLISGQKIILNEIELGENKTVIEIVQNLDGAIWFITDKEIYNHDGHELKIQSEIQEKNDRFTSIVVFGNNIYVGTHSGKLLYLNGNLLITLHDLLDDRVNKIVPYGNNAILVATNKNGLNRYDITQKKFERLNKIQQIQINDVTVVNNEIFLATDIGLFYQADIKDAEIEVGNIGDNVLTNLCSQDSRYLWMSEFESKLYRLDLTTHELDSITISKNNRINNLSCSNSRLFIASKKGLFNISIENESASISKRNITQDSDKSITSTLIDDEQNLWVGRKNNISKSSLLFSHWPVPVESEVHALIYNAKQLTLGTNDGVFKISYPEESIQKISSNINVTCMDAMGNETAIGTYDSGLIFININDATSDRSILEKETILALKYVSEKKLIVATLSGVHFLKKEGSEWQLDTKIKALNNFYILCIYVTDENNIWFGTDKKGAFHYNNGLVKPYHYDINGNDLRSIYSITKSGTGNLYASSKDLGLILFDNDEFEMVPSPHGDWSTTTSLCPIGKEQLLMVGVKEVSIFDERSQELMIFDKDLQILAGESFLNNYSEFDGQVFFEQNGRLFLTNIPEFRQRTHPLTSLKGVEVNLTKIDTSIHYYQEFENNFSFTFNGVLHRNPDKVTYSYILEGFDDEWRYTGDRKISYPHLEPGKYEFRVKSNHDNNFLNTHSIGYSFEIKKAFYNTLLFKIFLVALAIAISVTWYRNDRRQKETDNQLKIQKTETQLSNLKSQLNPHFLFNSFNTMIGLIEEDRDRSIEFIEHLTDFYRLVLEISEMELIPIAKEISMLNAYKHLLKERFPIGLNIEIEENWDDFLIPPLALQLLVENAVKHNVVSESKPLCISIKLMAENICVKNNYNPRPVPTTSTGIGLSNLKKRYSILANKNIELIISDEDVKVILPIILSSDKTYKS